MMKKTLENRQSFTRRLMQLLVLMAMLLAPKGAWAEASDYDLWVGGVQVTVANATSGITGSNITNGTVTFDASTNTLTLNGATVTGSYSSGGSPILSRLDALTIVIKGSCVLSSSDSCTAIRAEGTGDHVLTLKSGDTSCSLQFSVERAIRDFSSVTLDGLSWNADYTYKEFSGKKLTKVGDYNETLEVGNASLGVPYGLTVAGVNVTTANASAITGDNITSSAGSVSYNATDTILTLNEARFSGQIVWTNTGKLTVEIIGYSEADAGQTHFFQGNANATLTLTTNSESPGSLLLTSCYADKVMSGWPSGMKSIHISGDDAADYAWYGRTTSDQTMLRPNQSYNLWIKYSTWDDDIQFCDALSEYYKGVSFTAGTTPKLSLTGPSQWDDPNDFLSYSFTSSLPALTVTVDGEVTMNSFKFVATEDVLQGTLTIAKYQYSSADVNSLTLSDDNGAITGFSSVTISEPLILRTPATAPANWDKYTKDVFISDNVVNYGLTVAGTPVTNANLGNVLGDGTVSFTPAKDNEPATLTLDGAKITGNIEVNDLSALKIKVVGANTITAGEVSAIKSNLSSGACALTFSRGNNNSSCSLALSSTGVTAISTGFSGPTYDAMALVAEGEQVDYRSDYGLSNYVGNDVYNPVTSATITSYTTYDLIINGTTVTNLNREAIITVNGGTISFDGEHTLTLSNIPWYSFNSSYPFIQTSMDLTINLVGTSEPDMGNVLIQRNANDNETHTLTFATDETNPGMFIVRGGTFSHVGFNVVYNNHLAKNASGYFNGAGDAPTAWVAIPKYGLTIAGVEVTEANAGNVFGEELEEGEAPSVSFTPAAGQTPDTLKLNNASIILEDEMQESPGIIYEGTNNLTISIVGTDNTIQGGHGCSAIRSYAQTPPTLTFVNGDSNPCSLSLIGGDTPIDGFNVSINNALRTYTVTNVTPAVMISSAVQLTLPSLDGKGTITPEQGTYGTDQTTGALIYGYGQTVNLTYHPISQDYVLTSFKVINSKTNAEIETTSAKSGDTDVIYTFVMPSDPVTVTANFAFDISNENYTASIADATYTGVALVPTTVTLKISQDEEIELTNGTDFDITKYQFVGYDLEDVDEPINAGDYYVTIEGKGNYTGTATVFGYKINRANIPSGKYTVPTMKSGLTYTGADQALVNAGSVDESLKDIVELKYYHKSITKDEYEGTGYSFPCEPGDDVYEANVPKEKNAGYYAIVYKFFGGDNYYDIPSTGLMKVAIDTADIANATIEEIADSTYTGKAIKPNPTVTFGQTPIELTANTDYTVAYTNNVNVGKATFTITGKGNFKGTKSANFNIVNKTLDVTFVENQTWASFYNTTEDFNLPNNVMAYIVTEIGQNSVTVAPINYVPKNVAVLLENNTTVTNVTNPNVEDNKLQGAGTNGYAVTDNATVYALYNNKMMRVASGTTIPAGKCYLVVGVVNAGFAPQLNIVFENEGNTTGINASLVNSEEVKGDLYDLQGRKVTNPKKKGLYIQKGRKVVVNNK